MLRVSTGLRTLLLGTAAEGDSFQNLMGGGLIRIYSGSQPATADTAESGTLLATITLASGTFVADSGAGSTNGLTFDDAVLGVITKAAAETWSGDGVADGTAGWFRFFPQADGTGASTTIPRFDGSVGTTGAQLIMSSTTIANGAPIVISSFSVTLPTS